MRHSAICRRCRPTFRGHESRHVCLELICHKAACAGLAAAATIDHSEKHRSPSRNTPQPRAFRGTDAKEFPVLWRTSRSNEGLRFVHNPQGRTKIMRKLIAVAVAATSCSYIAGCSPPPAVDTTPENPTE